MLLMRFLIISMPSWLSAWPLPGLGYFAKRLLELLPKISAIDLAGRIELTVDMVLLRL
jgi:hypothetical protein